MATPDLVSLEKKTGQVTASNVGAGSSVDVTVTLGSNDVIVGVPNVSTATTNADVVLVNGGENSFVVRATNNNTVAQNIVIDYQVNVIKRV